MRTRKVNIVIGLSYGDEGKGVVVNELCGAAHKPLVVRFSGGHQVGHTVEYNDIHHVFSNFGSGTLRGVPTYWSEYCTVNPIGVRKEGEVLREKMGFDPINIYDENCMVTTPYDVYFNQKKEKVDLHGSVGVGFGTTIERNENYYKLHVRDLLYPAIRDAKLKNIAEKYYKVKFKPDFVASFIEACDELVEKFDVVKSLGDILTNPTKWDFYDLVFEGSQGILLDMDYGFFPNVTRSNTISKNAVEILKPFHEWYHLDIKNYYVSRAYQTRHGNGFITNEDADIDYIKENLEETNVLNEFQGKFRKGVLDLDLMEYAYDCDRYYNSGLGDTFVITCLDQVPNEFPITVKGERQTITVEKLKNLLNTSNLFGCYSPKGGLVQI